MIKSEIGKKAYDVIVSRSFRKNLNADKGFDIGVYLSAISLVYSNSLVVLPKRNKTFLGAYYFSLSRLTDTEFILGELIAASEKNKFRCLSVCVPLNSDIEFDLTVASVLKLRDELEMQKITVKDFFLTDGYDFIKIL